MNVENLRGELKLSFMCPRRVSCEAPCSFMSCRSGFGQSMMMDTPSGHIFMSGDVGWSEYTIGDLAEDLSNLAITRHMDDRRSMAQELVEISQIMPKQYRRQGLLYNAPEELFEYAFPFYKQDLPTFLKCHKGGYFALRSEYYLAFRLRFRLPIACPSEVRSAYDAATKAQLDAIRSAHISGRKITKEVSWSPAEAASRFLAQYDQLTDDTYGA